MPDRRPVDHQAATHYTLLAAERGVTSAMSAAAWASQHGIGIAPSAATAARWYRAAIGARGQRERASEEAEAEGEKLPGRLPCSLSTLTTAISMRSPTPTDDQSCSTPSPLDRAASGTFSTLQPHQC